ncbi:MFS transporter [Hyphomicrobium sp. 2TAF46]|uniref:MFS transporter n=1 Tax=Hyphomicrobium sp. 2TAF46 TaxID=3233019 RepID=UPI003F93237F
MSIQSTKAESNQLHIEPASGRQAGERRRWQSMAVLLVGNFVTILDLFIVNVALGSIQKDLHASPADVALFMVGYSAPYGVMLLNGARLGDLYGRRRIFLIGMALFTAASGLCGAALTPAWLIAARALQGLGAALLMPQVFASLRVLFEGDQRRRAFGIMGAVQGVAASISQLAGGVLIEYGMAGLGWRWVFLVNLPIGLAALVAGRLLIVETRAPVPAKLDLRGAVIGALGLALLLVPFMEGQDHGWPWWSVVLPLLSVPVFGYFLSYERKLSARGGVPIIDVALFANHRFVAGVVAIFLFYSAISSFFLSLTMLLQPGLGLSPLAAGAVFTPSAIAFFAASLIGPKLAGWIGRKALLLGVTIFWTAMALAIGIGATSPDNLPLLIVSLILNGAGQGLVIPLALNATLSRVREDQAGMGSGMVSTMQIVGTSVGVAIVGVLFFSVIHQAGELVTATRTYGHALAQATVYNVVVVTLSFVGFFLVTRE